MTLWSDFLRRMMLGATLSGPAVAIATDDSVAAQPAAELHDRHPDRQAEAAEPPAPRR